MSHYSQRPECTKDIIADPNSINVEQVLFWSSEKWGKQRHVFPVKCYHLTSSLKSPFLDDHPAQDGYMSRADALKIHGHKYVDVPSFTDPDAAMAFLSRNCGKKTHPEVPLSQSRLQCLFRLEMCYSSEHKPRHVSDILTNSTGNDDQIPWEYLIKPHNPMIDHVSRTFKDQGNPNTAIVGFDGMKMAGQPLVKDRWGNIWIEDRCDAAQLGMTNFPLPLLEDEASREAHVAMRVVRANAVIRFMKDFAWDEGRDKFFSRAAREVFLAAVQLQRLNCLVDNEEFFSSIMEPETMAILKLGRLPENQGRAEPYHIEAVADLAACFGIEVYNFMGKICENMDLRSKELLLRVAQIMLNCRREQRDMVIGFLECNQWLYDIVDEEQAEDVSSENVRHNAAKILMDVLARKPEFEELDVEPLTEENLKEASFIGHHAVQLANYQELSVKVRTRHGITARKWERGKQEIPSELEDVKWLRRLSDGGKFKAYITSNGAVIITKNNLLAKAKKAFSRVRSVTAGPVSIEAEYDCVQGIAHDHGGTAISSLLGGDYGFDTSLWILGCLHRGKVSVSSSSVDIGFLPSRGKANASHELTALLPREVVSQMPFLTDRKEVFWAPGDGLNVYRVSRRNKFYYMTEVTTRLDPSKFYKCSVDIHADIG